MYLCCFAKIYWIEDYLHVQYGTCLNSANNSFTGKYENICICNSQKYLSGKMNLFQVLKVKLVSNNFSLNSWRVCKEAFSMILAEYNEM